MKKYLKNLLVASALLANLCLYANVQPYASIQNLPATPYFVQDAYTYYNPSCHLGVEKRD